MNQNNQGIFSYNPVEPSYTFNGNNTNYNFLMPGTYDLRLNLSGNHQPRNSNLNIDLTNGMNQNSPNTAFNCPSSPMANIPSSPASVQGNQTGIPQSPIQREFSNERAPLPLGSSPSMSSYPTVFSSMSSIGTPPPRMINSQSMQSPMNREGFASPAPHARSLGNLSQEDIHPRTPRPTF